MELNNNAQFYKKLLDRISIFVCLFFIVIANMMRFNQLELSKKRISYTPKTESMLVYSASFFSTKSKNAEIKMIFLESYFDKGYLTKVLLKTNPKDILLLNCMEEKASSFVQFLSKNFENVSTTEASCDIEQSDLEIFLKQERALVVLLTESKNFSHQAALRVAERLALKPKIKMTEK